MKGFSAKYGCKLLVWYKLHTTMIEAITREKQIKAGSRAKKLALIEGFNPGGKISTSSAVERLVPFRHREAERRSNPCSQERVDCFALSSQ